MISLKNLLFLAVAVAVPGLAYKQADDAAILSSYLERVDTNTTIVKDAIVAFVDPKRAADILKPEGVLKQSIKDATDYTWKYYHNHGQNTEIKIAKNLQGFIKDTFEPHISATLSALVGKKSTFKTSIHKGVRQVVVGLKIESDKLSDALIAITPNELLPKGNEIAKKIKKSFNDAIDAYST